MSKTDTVSITVTCNNTGMRYDRSIEAVSAYRSFSLDKAEYLLSTFKGSFNCQIIVASHIRAYWESQQRFTVWRHAIYRSAAYLSIMTIRWGTRAIPECPCDSSPSHAKNSVKWKQWPHAESGMRKPRAIHRRRVTIAYSTFAFHYDEPLRITLVRGPRVTRWSLSLWNVL